MHVEIEETVDINKRNKIANEIEERERKKKVVTKDVKQSKYAAPEPAGSN